jgi:hypothetical protein
MRSTQASARTTWEVELTDLDDHQSFMGYSLSTKYMMVGITSPLAENQVAINSIQADKKEDIVIPLMLEKCDCKLSGRIYFKGIEKLIGKWKVFFNDNRFGEQTELHDGLFVSIRQPERNTRQEYLKLARLGGAEALPGSMFELLLKAR